MTLVLDASAILPLALTDEDAAYLNAVVTRIIEIGSGYTRPLFWNELYNVLVVNERRGRIEPEVSDRFIDRISTELPLRTIEPLKERHALDLARQFRLTVYDAIYLALAIQTDSELASADGPLTQAVRKAGVEDLTL